MLGLATIDAAGTAGQQMDEWREMIASDAWGHFYQSYELRTNLWPDIGNGWKFLCPRQRWRGQPYNKLVLVYEQGMGDQIWALRYASYCSPRPYILTYKQLHGLFERQSYVAGCRHTGMPDDYDYWLPLISVPAVLYSEKPSGKPYIEPHRGTTIQHDKVNIGINWAGNPNYLGDYWRSAPLMDFAPFFEHEYCRFLSLMHDLRKRRYSDKNGNVLAERDLALHPDEWQIVDCRPYLTDWDSTASLVANLDAVVTVDTALAHLAGAIGKPTALILPFNGEWRWGVGSTTAWYDSVRIFRQQEPGNWLSATKPAAEWLHCQLHSIEPGLDLPSLIGSQSDDQGSEPNHITTTGDSNGSE